MAIEKANVNYGGRFEKHVSKNRICGVSVMRDLIRMLVVGA